MQWLKLCDEGKQCFCFLNFLWSVLVIKSVHYKGKNMIVLYFHPILSLHSDSGVMYMIKVCCFPKLSYLFQLQMIYHSHGFGGFSKNGINIMNKIHRFYSLQEYQSVWNKHHMVFKVYNIIIWIYLTFQSMNFGRNFHDWQSKRWPWLFLQRLYAKLISTISV